MDASSPPLRDDQLDRYRRHLSLPEFGLRGQRALLGARVLLVGAGGLGCPIAQYLAAAGLGTLGVVDHDRVEASNLQRQVLYGTADVGRLKVDVLRERVAALNPDVNVEAHALKLSSANALEILRGYDVVVDGTDNFPTRYLTNDACVLLGIPNVYGSILRFEGQVSVFDARRGPCYRCLFPEPPPPGMVPSCVEGGVLGVLCATVASMQATEAIKLVAQIGAPLIGRLLHYDALEVRFSEFALSKDPACPLCGERPSITKLIDYEGFCGLGRGEDVAVTLHELTPLELQQLRVRGEGLLLLDVREPQEHAGARIEGARLIPLGELERRLGELADWKERPIVIHCHHGGRSARACALLQQRGFTRVSNLAGGIDAWSRSVDPAVPRY